MNLVVTLFTGAVVVLSLYSSLLQRLSLPGPLLALAFGVLIGPYAVDLVRMEDFPLPTGTLLEQAARATLAVGLTGVALRLPHGYWRRSIRWLTVIIGLGMVGMLIIATGALWAGAGVPLVLALLIAAIITPTDPVVTTPVVTTPVVTGSMAEEKVPERVRFNLSAESGINDGLGYLFVMLPVLLMTGPDTAWQKLLTKVLLWEVLGAAVFGALFGYVLAKLFVLAKNKKLMEESSYLAFVIPFGLLALGAAKLLGTDGVLAVFVAAAVFGQVVPERDEAQEDKVDDAVNRLFLLPVFMLLGIALPLDDWAQLGWAAPGTIIVAILARRLIILWALRPLLRCVHDRAETFFLSWFAPVGVSALFYATLAERHTGNPDIFVYASLAITASVVLHGLSTAPMSAWLKRHTSKSHQQEATG
nr:cation:proton antiporter [Nesterenkonia sp. Act20]